MTVLVERARAKINLTLAVRGRRADGYHDIDSIVAFAGCADRVSLVPGAALMLTVAGPLAAACGGTDDNLIIRAARALAVRMPGAVLGHFTLHKRLPVAAGIGGGSADAAAALRLLARVNGLAPDDARLFDAARATGADVPVCLVSRASRMSGIGDRLEPLQWPRSAAVLVNPGVAVATRDVFAALGLEPGERREDAAVPATPSGAPLTCAVLGIQGNDLEAPAIGVEPAIADVLAALRATEGCQLARMSGSGATCFALYDTPRAALAATRALRRTHPGWWVRATVLG